MYQETANFDPSMSELSGMFRNLAPFSGEESYRNGAFTTERQRRQHLNDKFETLKNLVPNPTKSDRASVVGDVIEYIKDLTRLVNELKVLVKKKKCSKEENGEESSIIRPNCGADSSADQNYSESMKSSWLQQKSKDREVDARIIDDGVTNKLVQKKKINCLLLVSKFLDELNLDIQNVYVGNIGDSYSFQFNSKICEGSSLSAKAIANQLIDVVDKHYAAAIPPAPYMPSAGVESPLRSGFFTTMHPPYSGSTPQQMHLYSAFSQHASEVQRAMDFQIASSRRQDEILAKISADIASLRDEFRDYKVAAVADAVADAATNAAAKEGDDDEDT